MAGGDLEERLRSILGLSGYEARAYLTVLRGARRPRDVARAAGIPPQRVYDVLEKLASRGLLARAPDGGYEPVPPREALGRIAEQLLLDAARRGREIRGLAEELEKTAQGAAEEYTVMLAGLEAGIAAALEALSSCSEPPVFTVYKAAEKAGELEPLLEPLLQLLSKRGGIILVYPEAPRPPEIVERLRRSGVQVIDACEAVMDMMIACGHVIIGVPSSSNDALVLVIKNRLFAEGLRQRLLNTAASQSRQH